MWTEICLKNGRLPQESHWGPNLAHANRSVWRRPKIETTCSWKKPLHSIKVLLTTWLLDVPSFLPYWFLKCCWPKSKSDVHHRFMGHHVCVPDVVPDVAWCSCKKRLATDFGFPSFPLAIWWLFGMATEIHHSPPRTWWTGTTRLDHHLSVLSMARHEKKLKCSKQTSGMTMN